MNKLNVLTRGINFIAEVAYNTWPVGVTMNAKTLIARKDLPTANTGYHTPAIEIFKDKNNIKKGSISIVRHGENGFLKNANILEDVMVQATKFSRVFGKDKNLTDDYATVTLDDEIAKDLENQPIYIDITKNRIFLETNLLKKVNGEIRPVYLEVISGKYVVGIGNAVKYLNLMYTSGSIKKGTSIWYKASIAKKSSYIINNVIPGVIDLAKKDMSQSDAVKFASRPGLGWSKNLVLCKLDTIAIFNGNFDDAANTSDGQVYIKASYVQAMFNLSTQAEAINIIMQSRIYGVYKFQAITLPDELFDEKLEELAKRGSIDSIGEGTAPVMLLDQNAIKAKIDPREIFLSMMALGKVTSGKGSKQFFEKVLIAAARQGKLDQTIEYLNKAGLDFIAKKVAEILGVNSEEVSLKDEYILDVLKKKHPRNPIVINRKYDDAMNAIANMIDKLAIELKDTDGNDTIFNAVVAGDLSATFGANVIGDEYVVFGKFSKMLAECHRKYGKESDEYKALLDKIGKFIAIKYPSMYTGEFASGKILDLVDLEELIDNNNKLSARAKRSLKFYFNNMSDATIMFPANREIFDTCAGMDTDFDKISVCFDKFIVELLYGKQESLKISAKEDDAASTTTKKISDDLADALERAGIGSVVNKTFNPEDSSFFSRMYNIQSKYEGNIGVITFYNNRVNAIYLECLKGNFSQAIQLLTECVGFTKGKKGKYKINRTTVNPNYVDDMIALMQEIEWSNDNILAFLNDCSKVFRLYQETTIDAAKTGIYLAVKLTVKTIVVASLLPVKAVKTESGVTIQRKEYEEKTIKIKGETKEQDRELKTIYFVDELAKLQERLIDRANKDIKIILEKNSESFSYTNEQVKDFKEAIEKVSRSAKGAELIDLLYTLKSIYNDMTSEYIESMANVNLKDDDADEVLQGIRDTYKEGLVPLANSIRRILSKIKYVNDTNLDAWFKGAIILGVSVISPSTGNANEFSKNRFAYNLLPDYCYSYLLGSRQYEAYGNVLQAGLEIEGTEVELVNGVSKNGMVIKERYTGTVNFIGDGKVSVTKEEEILEVEDKFVLTIPAKDADEEFKNGFLSALGNDEAVVNVSGADAWFSKDIDSDFVSIGNPVFFDGKKKEEYKIEQVKKATILVNQNKGTNKKDFWKETECYVVSLAIKRGIA